ncbi:ABC transporter permease, partial [Leeuwenhoekiella sp. UBA6783]|uniref:ABC transporter permease n=1 Tax=Leeuwenhoekiella sp. UBA6783 TaxID=1946747 RepID=UPI0025C0F0AC
MLRNYIKIAWRNLKKDKFYNLISLLGLTIGLTIAIFIVIWIQSELSYNSFAGNHDQIYRVSSNIKSGGTVQTWGSSTGPVAAYALSDIPEVKHAVRLRQNWSNRLYTVSNTDYELTGAYVDAAFFDLFDRKLLAGNKGDLLNDANAVVLTKAIAEKLFGTTDVVGKTLEADHQKNYIITGVVEDIPENSSVAYELFFSMESLKAGYANSKYWKSLDTDWGNFNYITYLELRSVDDVATVTQKLTQIQQQNDPNADLFDDKEAYYLQPITAMNLYNSA